MRPTLAILLLTLSACAHEDVVAFAGAAVGGAADAVAYTATSALLDKAGEPEVDAGQKDGG